MSTFFYFWGAILIIVAITWIKDGGLSRILSWISSTSTTGTLDTIKGYIPSLSWKWIPWVVGVGVVGYLFWDEMMAILKFTFEWISGVEWKELPDRAKEHRLLAGGMFALIIALMYLLGGKKTDTGNKPHSKGEHAKEPFIKSALNYIVGGALILAAFFGFIWFAFDATPTEFGDGVAKFFEEKPRAPAQIMQKQKKVREVPVEWPHRNYDGTIPINVWSEPIRIDAGCTVSLPDYDENGINFQHQFWSNGEWNDMVPGQSSETTQLRMRIVQMTHMRVLYKETCS